MRYCIILALLLVCISACRNPDTQEYPATIGEFDYTKCGSCGGQFVYIIKNKDTLQYRANLTPPFNEPQQKVLIRYQIDNSDGLKEMGKWITISSIRNRNE